MLGSPNCCWSEEEQLSCLHPVLCPNRRSNNNMAEDMNFKNWREVQRLERKRRYEMRCAIRQWDEHARAVRENEFLRKSIAEYESLHCIQNAMRRRIDEICVQEAAESRKKRIYDVVYRIKADKNNRAHTGLVERKSHIDHLRIDVQAQFRPALGCYQTLASKIPH